VEEITPNETQEVDAISSETLVTEDGEIKKRNIITAPEQTVEEEKNGMNYRSDANGELMRIETRNRLTFHMVSSFVFSAPAL